MLEYKLISVPKGRSSRDFAKIWDLHNGNFLAFVSDAPAQAEQRTGLYIKNYLEKEIEGIIKVIDALNPDEISLLMADLMTGINDELLRIAKGKAYAHFLA